MLAAHLPDSFTGEHHGGSEIGMRFQFFEIGFHLGRSAGGSCGFSRDITLKNCYTC